MKYYDTWRPKPDTEAKMREEWLTHKDDFISASEAAQAKGDSPWGTPEELWLIKTKRKPRKDISNNEAVQYGIHMEPELRRRFIENHPEYSCEYHQFDFYTSKERPWLGCTLDLEATAIKDTEDVKKGEEGVIEFKTGSYRSKADLAKWETCPVYYTIQVRTQMAIRGASFAHLYAELRYTGDPEYQGDLPDRVPLEYFFRYDAPAEKELLEKLDEFHACVMEDRVPGSTINEVSVPTTASPAIPQGPVDIEADVEIAKFTDNFDIVKAAIEQMVAPYEGVTFSEEESPIAREIAADLNKKIQAIETKRKAVKAKHNKPLNDFEKKAYELEAIITKVRKPIVDRLDAIENEKREAKTKEVKQAIADFEGTLKDEEKDFFMACGGFRYDSKWSNLGTTMAVVRKEIEVQLLTFRSDFKAIQDFTVGDDQLRAALLNEYARTRNLSEALSAKERILASRAAAEAMIKPTQTKKPEPAEENLFSGTQDTQPVKTTPKTVVNNAGTKPATKTITFQVIGVTALQNKLLAGFLKDNGFNFKLIEIV